jgi:prepilin-type N-terminal cleavage/methylation domain-containing protein
MKMNRNGENKGFTLIELLVVLMIIGILITLVSPQLSRIQTRGKLTKSAHCAKSIVEAIIAKEAGGSRFSGAAWPSTGSSQSYASSTAFLASLVEDGYLDVDYSFFAGPNMEPARNRSQFLAGGAKHNAWCILLNVNDSTPGNMPVVWTKNLKVSGGSVGVDENEMPYGGRGVAFATKNGEAITIEKSELGDINDIFTPDTAQNIERAVLEP